MSHYLNHPEIFNLSLLLTDEEKENPFGVLKRLCTDYHLSDLRESLWSQVEVCLTSDHPHFNEPEQRANLLYLQNQLERVFEAVFLLSKASK